MSKFSPFVTLSASYGTGGRKIGPAVAARLGVPFFDRAITAQLAEELGTSVEDPVLLEERPSGFLVRLIAGLSAVGPLGGGVPLDVPSMITDRDYRTQVDRVIREAGNASGGGVLLGRAAAVVLAEHPRALHVRLDGPIARRVQVVCQELGVDETKAADTVRINDAAREAYVKQLYGTDAKDPGHYNLVIDSTSIRHATCIELIVMAAQARNPEKPTAT